MSANCMANQQASLCDEHNRNAPQSPRSPWMDDANCSLPPVSMLFQIADASSATSMTSPHIAPESLRTERDSDVSRRPMRNISVTNMTGNIISPSVRRQEMPCTGNQSHSCSGDAHPQLRSPSLALRTDFSFDNIFLHLLPLRKSDAREPHPALSPVAHYRKRIRVPLTQQRTALDFFHYQPVLGNYYQSSPSESESSRLQVLPSFRPVTVPLASASFSDSYALHHHHYMGPIGGVSHPQSQDRFICMTCKKAFSRTRQLRTHSYSHTGEKPYKCARPGCGKSFSIRSNMKRHEKECDV